MNNNVYLIEREVKLYYLRKDLKRQPDVMLESISGTYRQRNTNTEE